MRIDHIAFRTKNREKTAKFFEETLGYRKPANLPNGFQIEFKEHGNIIATTNCIVLEPPEKPTIPENLTAKSIWWTYEDAWSDGGEGVGEKLGTDIEYHLAPEIFVSDGESEVGESIVGKWVKERNGIGGIHHIAYQVSSVSDTMKEWTSKGYAEFASKDPLTCPGLIQVFTKPSELTGVIFEFIERDANGFCKDNVQELMRSTQDFK